MEENIIESGYSLYKKMQERGLEIRKTDARDNGWFQEMCNLLRCPDDNLAVHLKSSNISAQEFLVSFLMAVQPFSLMFTQIWNYLANHLAPKVSETIAIRFGAQDEYVEIDLDQFRRYEEKTKLVKKLMRIPTWNDENMNALFRLVSKLDQHSNLNHPLKQIPEREALPDINTKGHPFNLVVKNIRDLFQQILEEDYKQRQRKPFEPASKSIDRYPNRLSDLLPVWRPVFYQLEDISDPVKDEAYRFYVDSIHPEVVTEEFIDEETVNEMLDILDLPFWKYRWHTYEIWCTVTSLNAVDYLGVSPKVENGSMGLDGYSKAIIADLNHCKNHLKACVVIQEQTKVNLGERKAIKPDLRFCFSSDESGEMNTATVIEFKQRLWIDRAHIEEVENAYSTGAPKSGGTIILNYDTPGVIPNLNSNGYYIENFRPDQPTVIEYFNVKLKNCLNLAGIERAGTNVVMIDISDSMKGEYDDPEILQMLRRIEQSAKVALYIFDIQARQIPMPLEDETLEIGGNTDLLLSLKEVMQQVDDIERILIVSDKCYTDPADLLSEISYRECFPCELADYIDWVTS